MADVNRILQVQLVNQFRKVVCVGIEVIAAPRLTRATMSATIMRDTAIATLREKEHLIFKRVCAQRPAVTEDNRLSFPPIFVVDVDVSSVFFSDSDVRHMSSFQIELHERCAARGRIALN